MEQIESPHITIGERIKKRRNELGMTQDELAKLTGYSGRQAINQIENGPNNIRQSKIVAFAQALQMPAVDLLGLSDYDSRPTPPAREESPEVSELNKIVSKNYNNNDFMSRMIDYARMLNEYYGGSQDDNRT